MDSANYLRGLLRSWWLVLVVVLAGGAGGYLVFAQATPQYAASVRIIVGSGSPDADAQSAATLTELRAGTFASVGPTRPVLQAVAEQAGLTDQLDGVSVAAASTQSFVTITVSGPDPQVALGLATAYPDVLPDASDDLTGGSGTPFTTTVVAPPTLPTDPFSPVLSRNVGLGLLAGLLLGLALAVLRESLNRTIRDSDELRRITGLTVLGTVPRDLPKELLPAASHPRSARAEAYRQVRTTLMSATDRRPLVVAVTSATPGEGKTSVATNLAVSLSRSGHRVALVDADLRRPRVADFFDIDAATGLTDVLLGEVALADALHLRDEGRLAVLPTGGIPANPSEALGGPGMQEVLRALAGAFEFVLIDTPPVLPVTDALVLAPWVDGVVVVARLGYTTKERVERAVAAVERVNAPLLGIVPNQSGKGSDADYSYTYEQAATRRRGPGADDHDDAPGATSRPDGRHRDLKPEVPVASDGPTQAPGRRSAGRVDADPTG